MKSRFWHTSPLLHVQTHMLLCRKVELQNAESIGKQLALLVCKLLGSSLDQCAGWIFNALQNFLIIIISLPARPTICVPLQGAFNPFRTGTLIAIYTTRICSNLPSKLSLCSLMIAIEIISLPPEQASKLQIRISTGECRRVDLQLQISLNALRQVERAVFTGDQELANNPAASHLNSIH